MQVDGQMVGRNAGAWVLAEKCISVAPMLQADPTAWLVPNCCQIHPKGCRIIVRCLEEGWMLAGWNVARL